MCILQRSPSLLNPCLSDLRASILAWPETLEGSSWYQAAGAARVPVPVCQGTVSRGGRAAQCFPGPRHSHYTGGWRLSAPVPCRRGGSPAAPAGPPAARAEPARAVTQRGTLLQHHVFDSRVLLCCGVGTRAFQLLCSQSCQGRQSGDVPLVGSRSLYHRP